MLRSQKTVFGIAAVLVLALIAGLGFAGTHAFNAFAQAPAPATPTSPAPNTSANPPSARPGRGFNLSQYRDTFLNNLATRLNTTVDGLKSALQGALGDTIDQAVKDGKLTQDQGNTFKNNLQNRMNQPGWFMPFGHDNGGRGHFGPGGGPMMGRPFGGPGANLEAVAKALNMQSSDLVTELQSGKSIADVAQEKTVDLATVKSALQAQLKSQLDQAVKDGKLTQQQADDDSSRFTSGLDNLLSRKYGQGTGFGNGMNGPRGEMMPSLSLFAQALNMKPADLITELQGGKTIAEVAKEKSVDPATLKTSVLQGMKSQLDDAVKNNKMTQQQADNAYNKLSSAFDTLVNNPFPMKPFHFQWRQNGAPQNGAPNNNTPNGAPNTIPYPAPTL